MVFAAVIDEDQFMVGRNGNGGLLQPLVEFPNGLLFIVDGDDDGEVRAVFLVFFHKTLLYSYLQLSDNQVIGILLQNS